MKTKFAIPTPTKKTNQNQTNQDKEALAKQIEDDFLKGEEKALSPWNVHGRSVESMSNYNVLLSGELKNRLSFMKNILRGENSNQQEYVNQILMEATTEYLKNSGYSEFLED